jgi:hypothetical protein
MFSPVDLGPETRRFTPKRYIDNETKEQQLKRVFGLTFANLQNERGIRFDASTTYNVFVNDKILSQTMNWFPDFLDLRNPNAGHWEWRD